ncbi:SIR2 family NAD-dependent protein deacylase [Catenibacterium sp.]|uniref:SIR2 family NAD-dependent protein deacylase n=1 Tax=Catenibacterium sp. TaxID=2049022 RepID=UPI003FD75036
MVNRYFADIGKPYTDLLSLVKDKDYFILTTNVDHCFQRAGFDKQRLFYTQGDYGLWQCSKACHQKTYDNEKQAKRMAVQQKNMKIPSDLVPYCPHCGAPMTMNLRIDGTFVQDEGWYYASNRYNDFLKRHENLKIVYLELGVGNNTPVIIKYPFWDMTSKNKNAVYTCINYQEAFCPPQIKKQSICIQADIGKVLRDLQADK